MNRTYVTSILLAMVAPWLLAYEFVCSTSWQYRRWLITLFFTIFGSVVLMETGDGLDFQNHLETEYLSMPFNLFVQDLWRILTLQLSVSGTKDVYLHVLSYLVGSVLGMPKIFMPIVATVYGYFFSGAVLTTLRNFRLARENYVVVAFVAIFLLVRGLEGFYTVRTWTAMWILVYSCLKYYETGQRRYLALMFVPPFVHVGYFVLAVPAWITLVFGSRPLLYAGVFLASSVTTILPVQEATTILSTTERGASQVSAYLVEEQRLPTQEFGRLQDSTNWYNAYRRAGLQRWAATLLAFSLIFAGVYQRIMNPYQQRIFSIGVLTLALSNATWFLYAVHNRSLTIAMIFLLAGFLLARLDPATRQSFRGLPRYYGWGLHLSILFFVPLILFNLSVTLDWMSVFMFGFPFLVWLDPELNLSAKELIREFLA